MKIISLFQKYMSELSKVMSWFMDITRCRNEGFEDLLKNLGASSTKAIRKVSLIA
jgi:hypothetical protein